MSLAAVPRREHWRTWTVWGLGLYVIGAVVFLALGGGRSGSSPLPGTDAASLGPVHLIEYDTLDGGSATLADQAGRPLVINFFASTCAPCREEMPDFETFHQNFGNEIAVVGLAVEGARPARTIIEETGVTFETGLDQRDIMIDLGGFGLPTTVFVDPVGNVVETHTGLLTYEALLAKVQEHFGT